MKIIKRWLSLKWDKNSNALDVEENDMGQLRNRKTGSSDWPSGWKTKDTTEWNPDFLKALENTPPTEDYTTPTEEQAKAIDALKKWIGND